MAYKIGDGPLPCLLEGSSIESTSPPLRVRHSHVPLGQE